MRTQHYAEPAWPDFPGPSLSKNCTCDLCFWYRSAKKTKTVNFRVGTHPPQRPALPHSGCCGFLSRLQDARPRWKAQRE